MADQDRRVHFLSHLALLTGKKRTPNTTSVSRVAIARETRTGTKHATLVATSLRWRKKNVKKVKFHDHDHDHNTRRGNLSNPVRRRKTKMSNHVQSHSHAHNLVKKKSTSRERNRNGLARRKKRGEKGSEEEDEDEDEEQDERQFPFPRPPHQKEERKQEEDEDEEQQRESEESEDSELRRHKNKNPFLFGSNRFETLFKNQYGRIRVLQRFNQRSPQLQNLRDYRILEFNSKPNTLLLPNHADADYLIVILNGTAILSLVNNDDRDSYRLQSGDALRVPSGTTYYVVNPDNNENLRLITLAIPVNKPGRFESFFLSSTEAQQSYLQGFSRNILEASYDTKFEEINKVLFSREEGQQQGEQRLQESVIVEISKEQIRALSKQAATPIYSNKLGKFFEITPEKNPQLRDLDIFLSIVDMNEGALLLPHFNSKAIVILVINEGDANIELVGLKEQQQEQQQEEQPLEVRKYRAELSEQDIFVIPAGYPVVVNATSNLNFFAIGINAENNQRNFLAGSQDNVISQIPSQVQELAFPGSAQAVEKLLKNQRESYFVDAQPKKKEEGNKGRKGPLSSILRAFY
ncbi:hypothetical protein JHK84_056320 [Glycine max]|nr:hypothetical protein JHK84_056320 [Glycine max]